MKKHFQTWFKLKTYFEPDRKNLDGPKIVLKLQKDKAYVIYIDFFKKKINKLTSSCPLVPKEEPCKSN